MPRDRRRHWSTRAFRALLALYPGAFRDEYGREVALVFADRYRDAHGAGERALVWIDAIHGVFREAPKEHAHMIGQDLRYALRAARKSPVFTMTAVLTLALGIGANTAIFQLIDAVGLRSLPIAQPEELAEVRIVGGNRGFGNNTNSYAQLTRPIWQELKAHQEAFAGMFAWATRDIRVGEFSDLRRARGLMVSGEFFDVLGVKPWRGRLIESADEALSCPESRAVVSYPYWQREMAGREPGPGTTLRVNGRLVDVVGVTPPGFFGLAVGETFDVAMAFCQPKELRRELFDIAVMGRLRPGWTLARASAHLDALSAGVFDATTPTGYNAERMGFYKQFRLAAYSASAGVSQLRERYATSLQLLLVITGLVLLIACANLANLMLARALTREREVSVRLALGASRPRILRQFLAESGLLAIVGALAGIALAQLLSRVLVLALATSGGGPALTLETSWRVLLFAAAVACTTCVIFGLVPAWRATRVQPAGVMKAGGRGLTAGGGRFSLQRVMVVTQIAVSLVLLVAALLFVRSFRNLMTFDPGIRLAGITTGFFGFDRLDIAPARLETFHRELLDEIRAIPGVLGAATTTNVLLTGSSWGHGVHVGAIEDGARFTWVSPGYFQTMGIPILEGRDFTVHDTSTSLRVAVVNETFVRRFSPTRSPIGQTLRTNPEPAFPETTYEIVGVIPDTQYNDLRGERPPMAFAPHSQSPVARPYAAVMVYSNLDPAVVAETVKRRIAELHPGILSEFMHLQGRLRDGMVRERLLALLAGFFGALAAVLAMVGLYGMMSFAVAQRRKEIGIRVALGAHRRQVVEMVMREAGWLLAIGVVIGTVLALAAGRSAATLLFGLTPNDPLTLTSAILLLGVIAAAASFLPARGASRTDPLSALRQD